VARAFFTIGHSNRSLIEFVELLKSAGIELIADVRRIPMSMRNPQFNRDALQVALLSFGIAYEHMAALGGLRGKVRSVPREINAFWSMRASTTTPTMRCRRRSMTAWRIYASRGSSGARR
jgi:uncharacterized protein (DUF488 family)